MIRNRPALVAFAWLFALMLGYYLVKPVRNALASELPPSELPYLLLAVLFVVGLFTSLYDWFARRVSARALGLSVTVVFAAALAGFGVGLEGTRPALGSGDAGPVRRAWILAFYLFVAAYNVLSVTMFWSFVNEALARPDSQWTYGRVAAGGTLGAACGSALVAAVEGLSATVLLLGGAGFLLLTAVFVQLLASAARSERSATTAGAPAPADNRRRARNALAIVRSSSLLRWLLVSVLLMTISASFLGYKMNLLVKFAIEGPELRTQFWGRVNLAVNLLALAFQLALIGPLVRYGGIRTALLWAPLIDLVGGGAAYFVPTLAAGAGGYVLATGSRYSVARVSREMLYTPLSRAARFQAKALIDTVVYRLGDATASLVLIVAPSESIRAAALLWLLAGLLRIWPAWKLAAEYLRALRAT